MSILRTLTYDSSGGLCIIEYQKSGYAWKIK